MTINDRMVHSHIHDAVLRVENYFKEYIYSMAKVLCLRNVTFTKGEFVSVLGPLECNLMSEK
jgi:hypothetical protein